jgi:hypothetical protein
MSTPTIAAWIARRAGLLGPALLLAGLALAATFLPDPDAPAPADVFREAGRPHACGRPGCSICAGLRAWEAANPGRRPGDLRDAAESAADADVSYTGDQTEASEADIAP